MTNVLLHLTQARMGIAMESFQYFFTRETVIGFLLHVGTIQSALHIYSQ